MTQKTESTTTDSDLSDDLFRVAMETTDDGRVNAEIMCLRDRPSAGHNSTDAIEVEFRLPSMRRVTESMDYPERDTEDYKFVRLCRAAGYSLASAEQLEGATVEAEQVGGEWVLHAPTPSTWREKAWHIAERVTLGGGAVVALAALPLFVAGMMIVDNEPGKEFDTHADMAFTWVMTTGLWSFGLVAVDRLLLWLTTAGAEVPI